MNYESTLDVSSRAGRISGIICSPSGGSRPLLPPPGSDNPSLRNGNANRYVNSPTFVVAHYVKLVHGVTIIGHAHYFPFPHPAWSPMGTPMELRPSPWIRGPNRHGDIQWRGKRKKSTRVSLTDRRIRCRI